MGLRESILEADDLPREDLPIPEWGVTVWVRTLSGTERDAFEDSNRKVTGSGKGVQITAQMGNFRARLAVLVCCDEDGTRLFSDEDAPALGRKSTAALDRIADVAIRLNRLGPDALEDAEKNSESAPSGNGTSSSREQSFTAP